LKPKLQPGTQIKVIGVGGGGGNAVDHMIERTCRAWSSSAPTPMLRRCRAAGAPTIQLGGTGLGAGSKPDKGREAAEAAADDIRQAIRGAHMLFITAGMGGGTGTGAAPVIARIAKEMGILTVGVVTKPFDWEGGRA
jgi:cell division protein FtsZ